MSTEATSRQDEHRTELYGVRGWLLLLCIYLFIVMPLIAILGAIGALQRGLGSALSRVLGGETQHYERRAPFTAG